jgi:hypothetical protein
MEAALLHLFLQLYAFAPIGLQFPAQTAAILASINGDSSYKLRVGERGRMGGDAARQTVGFVHGRDAR